MDLISDRGRRVTVDELNTTKLLAHAKKQAEDRKFDDILIVDCDAHHYENENFGEILPYMENDVFRQLTLSGRTKARHSIVPGQVGYQDMGGRVTRYPLRSSEKTEPGSMRDVAARPALDGRHGRRLFLPVSDRHAQCRPASAEGNGDRSLLGLQPLAHREGPAGGRRPHVFDAGAAVRRSRCVVCARSRRSASAKASPASW